MVDQTDMVKDMIETRQLIGDIELTDDELCRGVLCGRLRKLLGQIEHRSLRLLLGLEKTARKCPYPYPEGCRSCFAQGDCNRQDAKALLAELDDAWTIPMKKDERHV